MTKPSALDSFSSSSSAPGGETNEVEKSESAAVIAAVESSSTLLNQKLIVQLKMKQKAAIKAARKFSTRKWKNDGLHEKI